MSDQQSPIFEYAPGAFFGEPRPGRPVFRRQRDTVYCELTLATAAGLGAGTAAGERVRAEAHERFHGLWAADPDAALLQRRAERLRRALAEARRRGDAASAAARAAAGDERVLLADPPADLAGELERVRRRRLGLEALADADAGLCEQLAEESEEVEDMAATKAEQLWLQLARQLQAEAAAAEQLARARVLEAVRGPLAEYLAVAARSECAGALANEGWPRPRPPLGDDGPAVLPMHAGASGNGKRGA